MIFYDNRKVMYINRFHI